MTPLWILLLSRDMILSINVVDFSRQSFIKSLGVNAGQNVTLICPLQDKSNGISVIWYKQRFGEMPRQVGERLAYTEVKMNPVFAASGFDMNLMPGGVFLATPRLNVNDSGLYYCTKTYLDNFILSSGIYLEVEDDEDDVKVSVVQSGVWDSVPTGGSWATLQCSVLSESATAELRVLWFRSAPSQSHPQIIYTHHNNNNNTDQCRSSTRTCVYNISVNDTGTYYCAVALCGRIVFGSGTLVQLGPGNSLSPVVILVSVASALCLLLIFAHAVICKTELCDTCTVRSQHGPARQKRQTRTQDGVYSEVIYSSFH